MKLLEYNDDYQWFGDLNYYRGLVIIIIITTKNNYTKIFSCILHIQKAGNLKKIYNFFNVIPHFLK